jgi:hypothetical protein
VEISVTRHFRNWIAGLGLRKAFPLRSAQSGAGMLGAIQYYNPQLDGDLAERFRVWRLRGERDDELRHRLALAVQEEIIELEAILDRLTKRR